MLKKLFVFAGWLLLLCLVLLFCFTCGLWFNWNTTTIFIVWLGILVAGVSLWGAALWLTFFIKEKKTHRFFQKFRLSRQEYVLFRHWQTGAATVKRIQRKRPPIPWYLLLGDRCGKTSLLAGSGLSAFSDTDEESAVVPTRTLRWWFFRNICFLDLSSHFLDDTPVLRRAWGKLLGWIARIPAPAGIIIGVSLSDLLNENANILHDKARLIRTQIEPLTRKLKRQLPIYIVITQCDKFPGFSLWMHQLSVEQCEQALGYYWQTPPDINGKEACALLPLFTALKNGLDLARISMLDTPRDAEVQATLLNFPESFAQLQKPLQLFLASLCEANAYFLPVSLAGVWFTASEQQDTNKSRRRAFFVHDLLAHHLPAFSATRRTLFWQQNKRLRFALSSLLLLACVVMLGYSAVKSAALMQSNTANLAPQELANLLVVNESHQLSPLLYLPFSPLLTRAHKQIERQLVVKLQPKALNTKQVADIYQQQFKAASAQSKRQMILDLAETIITGQHMRAGATLEDLLLRPATPALLRLSVIDPTATPVVQRAAERWVMQQPAGPSQLAALKMLLTSLIHYDTSLAWLVAPLDFLPAVQANDFWPHTSNRAAIEGIWTLQGEEQISDWVNLLNQIQLEPELQHFMQTLPARRQDAWYQFLLSVTPSLHTQAPYTLAPDQLIALSQGKSPAMTFAKRLRSELEEIPPGDAQPWLSELRRLQKLKSQSAAGSTLQKVQQVDAKFRGSLEKWLRGSEKSATSNAITLQISTWLKWQNSLSTAANHALNQTTLSPALTDGLYAPTVDAKNINPLVTVFASFDKLRNTLKPRSEDLGIDAVWSLYKNDAGMLLAHAAARTGCWLNSQWQTKVVWPMRNAQSQDYEAQQTLTWQYLADFVRGPAKGLLAVSRSGLQPDEFQGRPLPLTPQFLSIARHLFHTEDALDVPERQNAQNEDRLAIINDKIEHLIEQQKELGTKTHNILVVSRPATIPDGARLIPTGSVLTLECQNGSKILDNIMNFAEQAQFPWQAGQCPGVKIEVNFPGFKAAYRYLGEGAWPDFLEQLANGEARLKAEDFEENADLLAKLNIRHVLVRFKISDSQQVQNVWHEWQTLDKQLTVLKKQKQRLEERKQSLRPSAPLRGRISELPEKVADCH